MSAPLDLLQQRLLSYAEGFDRILVGLSGGLDSTLLLHALCLARLEHKLVALHLDHGIHADSSKWAQHCRTQCERLGIEIILAHAHLGANGNETAAREARYQFFAANMHQGDALMLAHHADDQIETITQRLMRGAGPKGLAGMQEKRVFNGGYLIRPLLDLSREQILDLGRALKLEWIQDPSNASTRPDRNYLRLQVLPLLEQRWPGAGQAILATARQCSEAEQLLTEYAQGLLATVDWRSEVRGYSWDIDLFLQRSRAQKQLILRTGVDRAGLQGYDRQLLDTLVAELVAARVDAKPLVRSGNLELRRFRGRIYLAAQLAELQPFDLAWETSQQLLIPNHGTLQPLSSKTLSVHQRLRATSGSQGRRCKPLWRKHSQSLKNIYQEIGLPPWLRERVPVLEDESGEIVAVAGCFSCREGLDVPIFTWVNR